MFSRGTCAEDLMRGGLQILSFKESFMELHESDFVGKTMKERGHEDLYAFMADMVRAGKVVWENKERGINPDPALTKRMGVTLAAPAHEKRHSKKRSAPGL